MRNVVPNVHPKCLECECNMIIVVGYVLAVRNQTNLNPKPKDFWMMLDANKPNQHLFQWKTTFVFGGFVWVPNRV